MEEKEKTELRILREKIRKNGKRLTQERVGAALGIKKGSWGKIENGYEPLHPSHWNTVKNILGITEDELRQLLAQAKQKKTVEIQEKIESDGGDVALLSFRQALCWGVLNEKNFSDEEKLKFQKFIRNFEV